MPKTAVVLMAKYPEPGKVKTRLAAAIGKNSAYEVYLNLLGRIIKEVTSLDSHKYFRAAAVSPYQFCMQFQSERPGFDDIIPQVEGDLGVRMLNVIKYYTESQNYQSCLLVGADIPQLNSELIDQAADKLKSSDIVAGPTVDGGYYLIGMNKLHPELFENITWGTSTVLEQTIAKAKMSGLQLATLKELRDLDDVNDLEYFQSLKLRI